MTNAPTTRETADHAELLAGKACGDRMLAVAEALMPWLKNYPPSTRRERAIEAANAAIAASCAPLLSEIAALRGVCDHANDHWKKTQTAWQEVLAATNCKDGGELVNLARRATQAERQRDEARAMLIRARDLAISYPANAVAKAIRRDINAFLATQGAE